MFFQVSEKLFGINLPEIFRNCNNYFEKYLSTPVSSVTSEREFEVARDLANVSRTRLKPDNVEK